MAGSSFGTIFRITTWGETHGKGVGVVIDGCPAGLPLSEADLQIYLNRRKPGQSKFTTKRQEIDQAEILSGIFEGKTTGTPISVVVYNQDQHSKDYNTLAELYRPGHADYTFEEKYGLRDYRGGGRSSGRETIARVAAGAVAAKILKEMGITVTAYTKSIGSISIDYQRFSLEERDKNALYMPDVKAAEQAEKYLEEKIKEQNSAGGIVECIIQGMPTGVGETVFDKLSAELAKGIGSIGAVKGFEIGDGFSAAANEGSTNNDVFIRQQDGTIGKETNHAGGILGGMSDGSPVIFRAAFKPTPSISKEQKTVNQKGEEVSLMIHGRHDPIIVPRAVVVVEAMAACTILDLLLRNMTARFDRIVEFYSKKK